MAIPPAAALLLAFLLAAHGAFAALIAPAPAYYPRLALLRRAGGGAVFTGAALEVPTPSSRRLLFLSAPSPAGPWAASGSVIASAPVGVGAPVDLGNGVLLQLPNGTLLCAYRHHDGAPPNRTFRIQLASSHDFGGTWAFAATIAAGPLGVWEPFLYLARAGDAGALRVAYSAELPAGAGGRVEQDVVFQGSADGGGSWGAITARVHTGGSRNGMPGVALLPDGSQLAVFEGFWGGAWGAFTVNSARSFDGGASWVQRQVVHAPPPRANAGSPQVALCGGAAGKACAVFMSSEGEAPPGQAWPAGAHAGLLCAPLDAANVSAPIDWARGGAPTTVATETRYIFWPSLFAAEEGGAQVAYQGSDGAAYASGADVCAS